VHVLLLCLLPPKDEKQDPSMEEDASAACTSAACLPDPGPLKMHPAYAAVMRAAAAGREGGPLHGGGGGGHFQWLLSSLGMLKQASCIEINGCCCALHVLSLCVLPLPHPEDEKLTAHLQQMFTL
jgi:hypothetical protein